MSDDLITPYGLRQYAAALTLPNVIMLRKILYGAAKEIDQLATERDELAREIQEMRWAVWRLATLAARDEVMP